LVQELHYQVPYELAHHAFEKIAQESPDLIALQQGDQQMTFGELNEKAQNLAS
jgi:hypothetical protein